MIRKWVFGLYEYLVSRGTAREMLVAYGVPCAVEYVEGRWLVKVLRNGTYYYRGQRVN